MNNVTIYDVAGKAKCSLATVSRVINNPEDVKFETRERVLKVINELGYKPNAIARGLAARKSMTIGVVMSEDMHQSTAQLLAGISKVAKGYNYSIRIFSIDRNNLLDELNLVLSNYVDGIIFLNDQLNREQMTIAIDYLKSKFTPFVLTNVDFDDETVPSVNIDYEEATYHVTKEMILNGRKNICLFSSKNQNFNNRKKEAGYTRAINEASLKLNIFRDFNEVKNNDDIYANFINEIDIDGVVAFKDAIAIDFMNFAYQNGKSVPNDISIIGLQNTKYALLARPMLTCIDTPTYNIGAESMTLLTKLIAKENTNNKVILPYKVISRFSI